jgi:hypothetical protein
MYDWSACAMLIVMHYFAGAPVPSRSVMRDLERAVSD